MHHETFQQPHSRLCRIEISILQFDTPVLSWGKVRGHHGARLHRQSFSFQQRLFVLEENWKIHLRLHCWLTPMRKQNMLKCSKNPKDLSAHETWDMQSTLCLVNLHLPFCWEDFRRLSHSLSQVASHLEDFELWQSQAICSCIHASTQQNQLSCTPRFHVMLKNEIITKARTWHHNPITHGLS